MSKILANEIANYGDDSPIDLKEGLNIPAGKPVQAAGSSGTTGQVLSTTGTTVQWVTPFSGSYTDLSNRPTIPAAQVNSDWNASSGAAVILNKPVVPPQPSVTTASAGTAALTYNSGNGEFTFTPPDLSTYATQTYLNRHSLVYPQRVACSLLLLAFAHRPYIFGEGDILYVVIDDGACLVPHPDCGK